MQRRASHLHAGRSTAGWCRPCQRPRQRPRPCRCRRSRICPCRRPCPRRRQRPHLRRLRAPASQTAAAQQCAARALGTAPQVPVPRRRSSTRWCGPASPRSCTASLQPGVATHVYRRRQRMPPTPHPQQNRAAKAWDPPSAKTQLHCLRGPAAGRGRASRWRRTPAAGHTPRASPTALHQMRRQGCLPCRRAPATKGEAATQTRSARPGRHTPVATRL
mmetsp:Transcript_42949/g.128932  ORF Transcript_42949/g.128932 Transcript_42949/m.128932 type:complete len:218 (+) Transcript_42949:633-1286(+)